MPGCFSGISGPKTWCRTCFSISGKTATGFPPLYKYLLKAVYNRAINYIWKHKRDTEYRSWYGSQIDRMVFDYYDPDKNPILAKIYDNDMRQQLRQAVDELPDKRREIFRMRFFENMSNKEIGERLGLTVSTVENHMYLALKNLRDKLL